MGRREGQSWLPDTSIREAQEHMRDLGIVLKKNDYGEFVVNFYKGAESTAYYTDDLRDAYTTGLAMYKQQRG